MKNTRPRDLTLKISLRLTLIIVLPLVGFYVIVNPSIVWFATIMVFWVFINSYLLFSYSLDKFVYEKIRLIYKNIHNYKLSRNRPLVRPNTQLTNELLESVSKEVEEWAEIHSREIETMKKLESYRKEFLGNVSHELKTPIFNIQGYIMTLLDGGINDPEINMKYLQRTEQSIDRMIAIVEDLEQISKLESGELLMKFSRFDIVSLTKEVFDFLDMKAKQANIQLYFGEIYDKALYVNADKENIKRVLINLIENSVKYGKTEGGGRTKVSFFDMDENYLIEITDNGSGIEEQHIPRIFERFYRTDKSRSRLQGGTGLGLAIVKHIVEAHQQSVHVRSGLNIGSTFSFTLEKAD